VESPVDSEQLEKLKKAVNCPKNFQCIESSFESICHGVVLAAGNTILDCTKSDCTPERRLSCPFHTRFGDGSFCTCPLRLYAAVKLQRL